MDCVANIVGCCRKYKSGIGDESVVEVVERNEFDSEMIDLEDDTMQVLAAQMEGIYFSEDESEELDEYREYATPQEIYEYDPPLWMHQQIEENRLRFKQMEEIGEIYYSDEEDDEDAIEDGNKEPIKQPNCEIKDKESEMLPTEIVEELEEDEGHNVDVIEMHRNFAALPFAMPRQKIHPRGRVKKLLQKSL